MKFNIPLFPHPFELQKEIDQRDTRMHTLQLLETKLDKDLVKQMIEEMHRFYVEGQNQFREVLPQLIKLGAMTQETYDAMQADSPKIDSTVDFIEHLEAPFEISLPDVEDYKEGTFGISCECSWDPEHGIGAWFENWQLVQVGFAEVAYR